MSEPTPIEPFYQVQAKQVVDGLFDKGYFSEVLSRDGMKDVEDLLAFYFQTTCTSAVRAALMLRKVKEGHGKSD